MSKENEREVNSPRPLSVDPEDLAHEIVEKMAHTIGKDLKIAQKEDWLAATIMVVRDHVINRWVTSKREAYKAESKRVYYLSLEFLIGRLLRDAMCNLGLTVPMTDALKRLGLDIDVLAELEPDAALGNGGLGRLAACFMESMATVGIPAYGYGIRYDHGLFRQHIVDGWQKETPETWLEHGNHWEVPRYEETFEICFGGSTGTERRQVHGAERPVDIWKPAEKIMAFAYDMPIPGWRAERVNTLRLWKSRAVNPIQLDAFNSGDYAGALHDSNQADLLTRVLYPSDSTPAGQELRLRQEYFFTSASLQDILRRHLLQYGSVLYLADKVAIQLNDTHPAIAVAELMRLLCDEYHINWEDAWRITRDTISYTNHTLLPEALEAWPVHLFERLLPRHLQIIYAINEELMIEARAKSASEAIISSVSLIDEHWGRRVRMGNLAFAGSHSINGVSALHTDLMKISVFKDLNGLFPGRINNKTNGIAFRRWLYQCNPGLTGLLQEVLGDKVLDHPEELEGLVKLAKDAAFQERFAQIKLENKQKLAHLIADRLGIRSDPHSLFDAQIKRIHEYKRQLLNILETVSLYLSIREQPTKDWVPRVKIFAGKSAASYWHAKLTIKLINDVAHTINSDPSVRGLLKVVFLPNYNVSLAETIIPAADLSEQISTAGMEASGTGNMKFALNGALTIGTLDGANVEIRDRVGEENIVIFGLTAEEVELRRSQGHTPQAIIEKSALLREAIEAVSNGTFSPDDVNRFRPLMDGLWHSDWFMLTADFEDYAAAQRRVDTLWHDRHAWVEKTILNTANMAWFSSDRTIREYARDIWGVSTKQG
ncbi:glycogen/starch/alpha-glucan phosphorylase [Uliginosibacterium gangwonense]|uniref:glycogen/starch/alpha-glucan phosphorylase n=1 Tax=Uliginosibacterium gangwonense TaxID=392736 RepID=UPI000360C181|nr:glycogen/starch/alpha-glucan phosphorylase [Uliginosibacterium gangwonense]